MNGNTPRVALLHGPLKAMGMDPVSNHLFPPRHPRNAEGFSEYDATRNIQYTSIALRSVGIQVCYSGWAEDRAWLEANRELFDYLVISEQSALSTTLAEGEIKRGFNLPNNKQKLYYGALQGLKEIHQHIGSQAQVMRLRSDIFVNQGCIASEFSRLVAAPGRLLIEYINPRDPIVIPDFFLAASLDVLMALYQGLYQRSVEGKSFHWSTHIDHGLSIVDLTLRGVIRETQSMSKATFDFVVWRGVPRYLLSTLTEQTFAFDSLLNIPQELDFPKALASAAA